MLFFKLIVLKLLIDLHYFFFSVLKYYFWYSVFSIIDFLF